MNKTEFIQQASIQLMTSYTVNNQLMYNHDEDACWSAKESAEMAVENAVILWEELNKKGYTDSEPEEKPPISTTAFPEYSHTLDPEVREAIVAIFD